MSDFFKARRLGYWLTLAVLSVPFLFRNLFVSFNIHFYITHRVVGVICAILLVLILKDRRRLLDHGREVKWLLTCLGVFFLITLAGQLFNFQNPLYYYWGFRNSGRFFIFLFACILFLKAGERDRYMRLMDALYYVNFLLTLYQFFTVNLHPDYFGGIFGVCIGNGITNVFLLIIVTDTLVRYIHQREKLWVCLLKCCIALATAALAEIKVFFFEFVVILLLVFFLTRFSWKKVALMAGCALGTIAAVVLFLQIYPGWADLLDPRRIWETLTASSGYTGQGDLNRLNAIPRVLNEFLHTIPQKLFGLGFGNCDFGPTDALTPAFYFDNASIGYTVFVSSFIMMETGILGSIVYLAFYCVLFFGMHSLEKTGRSDPMYCQFGKIITILCFALYLYDSSLRTEPCFLLYFAIALPFLGAKKETT